MSTLAERAAAPQPAALPRFQLRARRFLITAAPLALAGIVALPILLLLFNSFNMAAPGQVPSFGLRDWATAFSDPTALSALWTSVALGAVRTAIALPIILALAWLIARSDMPGRELIELLCWLGTFLPLLPLTLGWILLLDPQFGLLNNLLDGVPFLHQRPFNIYSFWGIIWVHLASGSVYYGVVLLLPAFRRVGAAMEEAARICGANQLVAMLRVTVPLLAPAVMSVIVLSFVRSLEVFEVELLLGPPAHITVYSTLIYNLFHQEPPQTGEATSLGFVFLVVMVVLALLQQRYLRGKSFTTVTGNAYSRAPVRLGKWRRPALLVCLAYFAICLGAPLVFLVLGSFMRRFGFFQLQQPFTLDHWQTLVGDPVFFSSLRNTLIMSAGAAVLVVLLYSLVAYSIVRVRPRFSRLTDLLLWMPWAVPGILLSLGLLWLFLGTPLRSVLYGSVFGLTIAIVIKESPLSTQFFKSSFLQVGAELEECARVTGASWLRTYRSVLLPLLAPTAVTVGLLTFLSASRDISTPVLLYSTQSRPLSILMLEYSFAGELERGTAIGVLMTVFVLVVTISARALAFRVARERV